MKKVLTAALTALTIASAFGTGVTAASADRKMASISPVAKTTHG